MKLIQLDRLHIAYDVIGEGKPLIMIHGTGGTSKDLTDVAKKLSKNHKVYMIDSRGHGESEMGDKPFSIDLFATDTMEICQKLNIKECDAVGYGDGGNILLDVSIKKPSLIDKMVTISPNYSISGMKKQYLLAGNLKYLKFKIKAKFDEDYLLEMNQTRMMVRDYELNENDLNQIKSKVLILYAEKDMIKQEHADRLKNAIPNSSLEIVPSTTYNDIVHNEKAIDLICQYMS